jgi:uncharacterized protein YhhL (DUF1145 family)
MSPAKIALLVIYAVLIALAALQGGTPTGDWSLRILLLVAAAHVVECAVFFRVLRAAGGSMVRHLFNVFVFGVFHVNEVRQEG